LVKGNVYKSSCFEIPMSNRRGVSPVIATVLLIALVLVLALIIFLWSKTFISESVQKNGKAASNVCGLVNLDISSIDSPAGGITLQVVNRGSIPVYGLEIKFLSGSSSVQSAFDISVDVGGSASRDIPIQVGTQELIIYPVILGTVSGRADNKAYTCLENGKVINL
jgi:flagellin-like protein